MVLPTGINVSGTAAPAAGEVKEQVSPQAKETSALSVFKSELVPIAVRTPERLAEKVELSTESVDTLARTVASHLRIVEQIRRNSPANTPVSSIPTLTDLHKDLYTVFGQICPGVDLSKLDLDKPEDLEALVGHARTLVGRGGAEVRLALKLAEWEAATLEVASGRMFEEVKRHKVTTNEIVTTVTYVQGPNGLEKVTETKEIGWLFSRGRLIERKAYGLSGGERMDIVAGTTAGILTNAQQEFLTQSDWVDGPLDSDRRKDLDKRLESISSLRTELYQKTGVKLPELNFIKKDTSVPLGRKYIDTKVAHFIGEPGVTGTNVREILEAEGVQITTEVKNKVQAKLVKAQEEEAKRTIEEDTPTQLEREITRLKNEFCPSPERQVELRREFDFQIKILSDRLSLFTQSRLLPAELDEAKRALETAENDIKNTNATIAVSGESSVDLLAWAGLDKAKINESVDSLKRLLNSIKSQDHLQHQIDECARVIEGLSKFTPKEGSPSPEIVAQAIQTAKTIQTLAEKRSKDNFTERAGSTQWNKPITEVIADLEAKISHREKAVAEQQAKIDQYKVAKAKIEETTRKIAANTATLSDIAVEGIKVGQFDFPTVKTEADIDAEIKKLGENKENVDKGPPAVQLEIHALSVLKGAFGTENRNAIEQRCGQAESVKLPLTYITGTGWEKYPVAVLRVVQLIWGNDVLQAPAETNKEKVAQIRALIGSQKYLDIIVGRINSSGAHLNVPANIKDGSYIDVASVFAGSAIMGVPYEAIRRNLIDEIIKAMRMEALHLEVK